MAEILDAFSHYVPVKSLPIGRKIQQTHELFMEINRQLCEFMVLL